MAKAMKKRNVMEIQDDFDFVEEVDNSEELDFDDDMEEVELDFEEEPEDDFEDEELPAFAASFSSFSFFASSVSVLARICSPSRVIFSYSCFNLSSRYFISIS